MRSPVSVSFFLVGETGKESKSFHLASSLMNHETINLGTWKLFDMDDKRFVMFDITQCFYGGSLMQTEPIFTLRVVHVGSWIIDVLCHCKFRMIVQFGSVFCNKLYGVREKDAIFEDSYRGVIQVLENSKAKYWTATNNKLNVWKFVSKQLLPHFVKHLNLLVDQELRQAKANDRNNSVKSMFNG